MRHAPRPCAQQVVRGTSARTGRRVSRLKLEVSRSSPPLQTSHSNLDPSLEVPRGTTTRRWYGWILRTADRHLLRHPSPTNGSFVAFFSPHVNHQFSVSSPERRYPPGVATTSRCWGPRSLLISVLCLPARGLQFGAAEARDGLGGGVEHDDLAGVEAAFDARDAAGQQALVVAQGLEGAVVDLNRAGRLAVENPAGAVAELAPGHEDRADRLAGHDAGDDILLAGRWPERSGSPRWRRSGRPRSWSSCRRWSGRCPCRRRCGRSRR